MRHGGAELVGSLPGTERLLINFTQHSGFLQASATHKLFYWCATEYHLFVESDKDATKKPLIIWFSGGPGCSSVVALLNAIGPFEFAQNGHLQLNPYSWHKTIKENYDAIKDFFKKHPKFLKNPLYLMGESYAGIFVPVLAVHILKNGKDNKFNLKGLALGNPFLHEVLNIHTSLIYAYEHALIDQHDWDNFVEDCCHGCEDGCDFRPGRLRGPCLTAVNDMYAEIWNSGLNPFDIYRDCSPNSANLQLQAEKSGLSLVGYKFLGPAEVTKSYKKEYDDMSATFKWLMSKKFSILLYYGDTDLVCNFLMGQRFAYKLNLKMSGREKQNWHVDGHAGFKTLYQTASANLTFLTVRGAGHMAAQWRAPQVFHAVSQFIQNKELS
ncbi:unnamed protein product [Gongylonema pulchrum]|uniref:Carboxypeptidase n=1 Tax=Gongylonema pulchrum TaxID=637853 RepID=A0A183E2R8_9BILA|nr:unnamed protein product [Gongylonema pulchrum]